MLASPMAETVTAVVADPRFVLAAAVALIAGLVRGFSGFGSALIYVPLVSAIYEPRLGVITLLIVDFVSGAPFAIREAGRCNWRELLPVAIAAAATVPVGALALQYVDPIALRWAIAGLVMILLALIVSGWRYQAPPTLAASVGVGLFSGVSAGAVQIAGPAVIIYWLGGPNSAAVVRANLMVFFVLLEIVSGVTYYARGLLTADVLLLSLLLGPIFILAMLTGALMFRAAADQTYRRVSYAIIGLSALLAMPIFDRLFR